MSCQECFWISGHDRSCQWWEDPEIARLTSERDAALAEVARLKEKLRATAAECARVCEEQAERLAAKLPGGEDIWKDGDAMAAGARHCAIYVKAAHTDAYVTLEEIAGLRSALSEALAALREISEHFDCYYPCDEESAPCVTCGHRERSSSWCAGCVARTALRKGEGRDG